MFNNNIKKKTINIFKKKRIFAVLSKKGISAWNNEYIIKYEI